MARSPRREEEIGNEQDRLQSLKLLGGFCHFFDLSSAMGNPVLVEMRSFLKELKHAFAVDPIPGGEVPLPASLERFAEGVVERNLETPAILLLETARPLSFLSSQLVFAASPLMQALVDGKTLHALGTALEDRRMVGRLIERIENLSQKSGSAR